MNNFKSILQKIELLHSAYITADNNDDEENIELIEDAFDDIVDVIKSDSFLTQQLMESTDIYSEKKLFRKFTLSTLDDIITFETHVWYLEAAKDKLLWNENILQTELQLIVHEYKRLKKLLIEGQLFGVLLEIKDIFELLLKLPTLLFASYFFKLQERDIAQNKILMQLIIKPISLGDWQSIATLILKSDSIQENDPILYILKKIVTLYRDNSIVNWRNSEIGHGALMLETDEVFIKDILDKVKLLKSFFDSCESELLAIKVNREKAEIYIYNNTYTLKPYIYFIDESAYFFDSFYSRKNCAYGLDYQKGKKSKHEELFHQINNYYVKEEKNSLVDKTTDSLTSNVYKASVVSIIDKIAEVKEIIQPNYLEKWLRESLKSFKKGVFVLEAERGMGKSTFARMLDMDSLHKINFQDTVSKAYYINDSFRSNLNMFIQETRNNLSILNKEKLLLDFDLSVDTVTPTIFADYLNKIRNVYISISGNYDLKLLYIIDGLDEIPEHERTDSQRTIFDVIPNAKDLDDGVFILLTNRTQDEITSFTKDNFEKLPIQDKFTIARKSSQNISVLKSFAKKYILNSCTKESSNSQSVDELLNLLYNKSDYRMLHLYMIKELLSIGGVSVEEIPETKDLLDFYLKNLEKKYGEKYFHHIIKILIILATQYEEMTINEISYLVEDEGTSFKLLAFMLDLRGLLKSQRDIRGNKFSIAHHEIKEKIKTNSYKNEVLTEVLMPICSLLSNFKEMDNFSDGETYILSHALSYNSSLVGEYNPLQIGELNSYYQIAIKLSKSSMTHLKIRANYIYLAIIEIESNVYAQSFFYYKLAINYFEMNNIASSYDYLKKMLSVIVSHSKNKENFSYIHNKYMIEENELIQAEEFYVHVALRSGDFENALKVGNSLISNTQKIHRLDNVQRLYLNMAKVYLNKYEMNSAFEMYEQAKEFTLDKIKKIHIEIEIAKTYRKNGNVEKSKELLNDILQLSAIQNTELEAEAKIQFGLCCFSDKKYQLAYQYYSEADELLKTLDSKELLLYNWLGISTIYEYLKPAKVIEAKELLELIMSESKKYGFVNFYIDSMNGLSRKYLLLNEYDQAIFYAKKGAMLWKAQGASGGLLVMYSHIINALTGKYLLEKETQTKSISDDAKLYLSLGKDLKRIVTEKVLLEIFNTSVNNWNSKTLNMPGS